MIGEAWNDSEVLAEVQRRWDIDQQHGVTARFQSAALTHDNLQVMRYDGCDFIDWDGVGTGSTVWVDDSSANSKER